jgi:hypothetical protein
VIIRAIKFAGRTQPKPSSLSLYLHINKRLSLMRYEALKDPTLQENPGHAHGLRSLGKKERAATKDEKNAVKKVGRGHSRLPRSDPDPKHRPLPESAHAETANRSKKPFTEV